MKQVLILILFFVLVGCGRNDDPAAPAASGSRTVQRCTGFATGASFIEMEVVSVSGGVDVFCTVFAGGQAQVGYAHWNPTDASYTLRRCVVRNTAIPVGDANLVMSSGVWGVQGDTVTNDVATTCTVSQ